MMGAFACHCAIALGAAVAPLLCVDEAPRTKLAGLLLTPPAPPPLRGSSHLIAPRAPDETQPQRVRTVRVERLREPARISGPVREPPEPPVRPEPRLFDMAALRAPGPAAHPVPVLYAPDVPVSGERESRIGGGVPDGSLDGLAGGAAGGVAGGVIGGIPGGLPGPPPQANQRELRVKLGGKVEHARLIHKVIPEYPSVARSARVQGVVVLEAIIGIDGRIKSVEVLSGHPLLTHAAADAVRRWRYEPMKLNGVPQEATTRIEVRFRLVGASAG